MTRRRFPRWRRKSDLEAVIDERLARLGEVMLDTPSPRDTETYTEKLLADLFSGRRQPNWSGGDPNQTVKGVPAATFPGVPRKSTDTKADPVRQEGKYAADGSGVPVHHGITTWLSRPFVLTFAVLALVALLVFGLPPILDRHDDSAQPGFAAGYRLNVAVLQVVDIAPLYRAMDMGYFKTEGIDIHVAVAPSGPKAVEGLANGQYDVAFSSYPGIFGAQINKVNLKLVAPAYTALSGHLMLMGSPDDTFTKPEQVRGKTIAVTAKGSISDLGVEAVLAERGISSDGINWVEMAFPEMVDALRAGQIDGAVLAEPFVTEARQDKAWEILDVGIGQTNRLPMSGWAITAQFARQHADKAEAFRRALRKGAIDVGNDPNVRNKILVDHLNVDPKLAPQVRIGIYPTDLDESEIKKVAILMRDLGVVKADVDVGALLLDRELYQN